MSTRANASASPIRIACAIDDGYAMPLAVMIRSIIDTLGPGRHVELYVLDGGVLPATKNRLLASWTPQVTLKWLQPDVSLVQDCPVSHHVNFTTYLRLLLPSLLADDIDRIIYLDSDMLVRRDIGQLWDEPQHDLPLLAVQDMALPWMDSELTARNFQEMLPYLAAIRPVLNYKQLGIRPEAPYFNAGMIVINLKRWRQEAIAAKVFECLDKHREHVLWWDQYALNAVLADRWGQLDIRWNQGAHVFVYPTWRESPLDRDTFERLKRDPWIVHYCSPSKPWQADCDHPYRREFFRVLDRTAWRGWRPQGAPTTIRMAIKQRRKRIKRALQSAGRRVMTAASQLFRRAA